MVRSQKNLSASASSNSPLSLQAVPDVKDDTVGRFAAGRFRQAFRSLRPLLDDRPHLDMDNSEIYRQVQLSQAELDDEAHSFALMLIQKWIADPSNVRLLRVALDLWPSPRVLTEILQLFEPYLSGEINVSSSRRIVYYCLAEILRAGATETGFIEDTDCVPKDVDLPGYRKLLLQTALRIAGGDAKQTPWYLVQQALLYIGVHDADGVVPLKRPRSNRSYWSMIAFLQKEHEGLSDREFAISAIVSRRSFLSKEDAINLISRSLTAGRFNEIAARDIEFANHLSQVVDSLPDIAPGIAEDLGNTDWSSISEMRPLQQIVHEKGPLNLLRNEIGILTFAKSFLKEVKRGTVPSVVTPSTLQISVDIIGRYGNVKEIVFRSVQRTKGYKSIYTAPSWVDETQRWRFQLGYLLRFILTAQVDFGLPVRPPSWKETEPLYRPTRDHWVQRHYGFYNGHEAFGEIGRAHV